MKATVLALCLALFASSVSALPAGYVAGSNATYPDYIKYGYQLLTDRSNATTCTFNTGTGSKSATCPPSTGVPQTPISPTSPRTDGSTTCVAAVDGKSYEAVFSLTYPSDGVPGCTDDAQCSPTGVALPGLVCATNGPTAVPAVPAGVPAGVSLGVPKTCFPLAPSGCPFTGDTVQRPGGATPAVASAGRKMAF